MSPPIETIVPAALSREPGSKDMSRSNDTIATLTLLHPGGHNVAVTGYLTRKESDEHDWEYWCSWSTPAIRHGRARYVTHVTGMHGTLVGALGEAVERIQSADPL